jgi:hypothetical protein
VTDRQNPADPTRQVHAEDVAARRAAKVRGLREEGGNVADRGAAARRHVKMKAKNGLHRRRARDEFPGSARCRKKSMEEQASHRGRDGNI